MEDYEAIIVVGGGVLVAILGICCKGFYKIKISELSLCWQAVVIRRSIGDEIKRDIENPSEPSEKTPRDEIPSRI
jgi:hypothetical protein